MKKMFLSVVIVALLIVFSGCGKEQEESQGFGEQTSNVYVVFKQIGEQDITLCVEQGGDITTLPTPKAVKGYTVTWEVTALEDITEDMVVNAVITPNSYTIYLDYCLNSVENDEIKVDYDANYTLPRPTHDIYGFIKWINAETGETVESGLYQTNANLYLKAVWDKSYWTGLN